MESACLLHAATGNARTLEAGRLMQASLADTTLGKCGFASIADVETGEHSPLAQPVHPHACLPAVKGFSKRSVSSHCSCEQNGNSFVMHLYRMGASPACQARAVCWNSA